jgi:hypothetical protein
MLWNPLWGASYLNINRRELYTHALHYGALWSSCALKHDDHSLVLSAGSDGTVRCGYTCLMTSTKGRNATTMELCKVASVAAEQGSNSVQGSSSSSSSGAGLGSVCIALQEKPTLLASGAGEEKFTEGGGQAWQCIDAVTLTSAAQNTPSGLASGTGAAKAGKKAVGKGAASSDTAATPAAELVLVAYGSATGLVRIHAVDPLRILFSGTSAPTGAGEKA